jgi:hypothetical protein
MQEVEIGADVPSGCSRYRLMDGVGTLGGGLGRLQCREMRAEMEVRDWRRRSMRQCEIGERKKDQTSFF